MFFFQASSSYVGGGGGGGAVVEPDRGGGRYEQYHVHLDELERKRKERARAMEMPGQPTTFLSLSHPSLAAFFLFLLQRLYDCHPNLANLLEALTSVAVV